MEDFTKFGSSLQGCGFVEALYTDTCSCISVDGIMSDWFEVCIDVRQGCKIAPDLFLCRIDYLLDCTVYQRMPEVCLKNETFTELDFADDVALLGEMLEVMQCSQ